MLKRIRNALYFILSASSKKTLNFQEIFMFKNTFRFTLFATLLFVCAGIVAAQGPKANTNTTTAELEMTANVQTAVQLNISTGTGGATVGGSASTGLFNVSFGNINGLGTGNPSTGISVVADSNGALYKTPITVTPIYSGFTFESANITVQAGETGNEDLVRESDSSISPSSTVGTTPVTVISGAASSSNNERFVGFYVPRTEPAGSKTATLIYTVTVE